jgi:hypothetical protein
MDAPVASSRRRCDALSSTEMICTAPKSTSKPLAIAFSMSSFFSSQSSFVTPSIPINCLTERPPTKAACSKLLPPVAPEALPVSAPVAPPLKFSRPGPPVGPVLTASCTGMPDSLSSPALSSADSTSGSTILW